MALIKDKIIFNSLLQEWFFLLLFILPNGMPNKKTNFNNGFLSTLEYLGT
jgi:hypothetical protein